MPQLRQERSGSDGACPDASTILAVIEGEADEWLRNAYAQHLAQCSACLELDSRLRNFDRPVLADEAEWRRTEKRLDNWLGAFVESRAAAARQAVEKRAARAGFWESIWRPGLAWKLSLAMGLVALVAVGASVYPKRRLPFWSDQGKVATSTAPADESSSIPLPAETPHPKSEAPKSTERETSGPTAPLLPGGVINRGGPMAAVPNAPQAKPQSKPEESATVANKSLQSERRVQASLEPPPAAPVRHEATPSEPPRQAALEPRPAPTPSQKSAPTPLALPQEAAKVETTSHAFGPLSDANDPNAPHESGIYAYVQNDSGRNLVLLEPALYTQGKSGGTFAMAMTYGIAKAKWKAIVHNPRAKARFSDANPVFYFYLQEKSAGMSHAESASTPNEFKLLRLETKGATRETVVMKENAPAASSGTEDKANVPFTSTKTAPGVYKVVPNVPLKPGEYAFISAGATGASANRLFDFGVDTPSRVPAPSIRIPAGTRVWIKVQSVTAQREEKFTFRGSLLLPVSLGTTVLLDSETEFSGSGSMSRRASGNTTEYSTSLAIAEIVVQGLHYRLKSVDRAMNAHTVGSGTAVRFDSGGVFEMWLSSDSTYERAAAAESPQQ